MVNAQQGECFFYFIQSSEKDVTVEIQRYQGHSEGYMSIQDYSSDSSADSVPIIFSDHPSIKIVLSVEDRTQWGVITGLYYFCFNAY
mmetsp:Transcript_22972/g.22317  ORF Transcript_22972/g.22317 Transcript_22972/m.22317 type:complete len:87 (+) Transcript_22972:883-1143(+)